MKAKFYNVLFCAFAVMPIVVSAQDEQSLPAVVYAGTLGGTPVAVPYDASRHVANKTTSAAVTYTFSSGITTDHADWVGALQQACSTWGQILPTATITVGFHLKSEYPGIAGAATWASGVLMQSLAPWANGAGFGFIGDAYYPDALALYLGASMSVSGNQIDVYIDPSWPWYTNTDLHCPSTQYDMIHSAMHEIGHGVGFRTTSGGSGTSIAFGYELLNPYPSIYDWFINDQGSGDASGSTITFARDLPAMDLTYLGLMFTGQAGYDPSSTGSNTVWFDGASSPYGLPALVQLYAPSTYALGGSISHDLGSSSANLMSISNSGGYAVQCPTEDEIDILDNIGWGSASTSSVGFGSAGMSLVASSNVFDISSAANSYTVIPAVGVGIIASDLTWYLKLYANDGIITVLTSGTTSYTWSPVIASLPSGHTWIRDLNGRIQGTLTVVAGGFRPCAIDIGLNYAPDVPLFNLTNSGGLREFFEDISCDQTTLLFSAAGADHFVVTMTTEGPTPATSSEILAPGVHSYTVSSLNQYNTYQFSVQAVNTTGVSNSSVINKYPCLFNLEISPNPVQIAQVHTLTLKGGTGNGLGGGTFLFNNVTIVNSRSGDIITTLTFDGTSSTVTINLSLLNLCTGFYTITANDTNGETAVAELQVAN